MADFEKTEMKDNNTDTDTSASASQVNVNADEDKPTESKKRKGPDQKLYKGIAAVVAAAIIGGAVGYCVKPVAKTDDMVVTEDVSGPVQQSNTAAGKDADAETYKPYTQITSIMDNARHVIEERYYASDGSIVANEDGYAIMRKSYDEKGNLVSTSYYDVADQPFFVEKLGYSSVSMSYDDNNNKIGETYYDAKGTVISLENNNYAGA